MRIEVTVNSAKHFLDINECLEHTQPCDINADCNNLNGTYNCSCKSGYQGDGFNCTGELRLDLLIWYEFYQWKIHFKRLCILVKGLIKSDNLWSENWQVYLIIFKTSTSVRWTWANAMKMQIAQTLMDLTTALAIMDMKAMDSTALVNSC